MQCQNCQREVFKIEKPCPHCGFQSDVNLPKGAVSRQAAFAPEEVEKAWLELERHEMLFLKVDEWRKAGYFTSESGDPVRARRAYADELRGRLKEYQRADLHQTDEEWLQTLDFLLDNIDLIASRGWFKSKKEMEKAVVPIMAMFFDVILEDKPE